MLVDERLGGDYADAWILEYDGGGVCVCVCGMWRYGCINHYYLYLLHQYNDMIDVISGQEGEEQVRSSMTRKVSY
jgi:hypothetical protein